MTRKRVAIACLSTVGFLIGWIVSALANRPHVTVVLNAGMYSYWEQEQTGYVYCPICEHLTEPTDVAFDQQDQLMKWDCPYCDTSWACAMDDWPPKTATRTPFPSYVTDAFQTPLSST